MMTNKTIWDKDYNIGDYQKDNIECDTDILIIGAGITGLTTAYFLQNTNKKVIIIDKGKIGCGITHKTTGKISYLQGDIYSKLSDMFNKNVAKTYFNSQIDATKISKDIITTNNIDCDLEKVLSIVFTLEDKNIKKILKEKEILQNFKVKIKDVNDSRIKKGISVDDTYIFNPIKYINSLAKIISKSISIYENVLATSVKRVDNSYQVITNKGIIKAKTVVFACHYPFFIIPSFIPLKTYVKREYVNASKMENKKFAAISVDNNLHSIRFYNDYIIYGSCKHKLTNKIDYKENYDNSKKEFIKFFNQRPEYTWMNQDIVSNDILPFIGEVKDNLFIATAFNGWGMTCGTIAGKVISDLILYKKSKYKELFSPKRNNFNLIISSAIGSFNYLKAYAESFFKKNNPEYIKIKGIIHGVYTDDSGKRHFIKLICPHMKCQLVFNREEKTWDCPCHGSRFDIDGNLIEGPAKKNIN